MRHFIERGGLWIAGQAGLMILVWVGGLVWRAQWESRGLFWLSAAAFGLSAALGLLGALAIGRGLTPFPKPGPRLALVQRGVYGLIRHPLYASLILAALGWGLLRASGPALAMTLVLAVYLDAKARREERWLQAQFPEYAGYARRVRRLIPWLY